MLVRPFVADAGVNQDALAVPLDDRQFMFIRMRFCSSGGQGLTRGCADHAEHRTAVEAKLTVRNDLDAIVTKLHHS